MAKEIKVRLYASENDDYVELWRTFDEEPSYYGRYTYNDFGTWYYVSDPLGYCELDRPVADDVTFICCNANGDEDCRYSNADPNPLVKFETYVKAKWDAYKDKVQHNTEPLDANFWTMCYDGTTVLSLNKWLLSFKDPELYGKDADDYDENWYGCWHEHQIAWEPLEGSEFTYMGDKFQFTKVTHKHDVCGVEWFEYVCTTSPYTMCDWATEGRPWIVELMFLGDWFDPSIKGTMYDKHTAKVKVANALKTIYNGEQLSKINNSYGYVYELFVGYNEAAEELLKRNYSIKHVDEIIAKEKEVKTFEIVSDHTIEERYPGVVRDHKYNYDCFGRRFA